MDSEPWFLLTLPPLPIPILLALSGGAFVHQLRVDANRGHHDSRAGAYDEDAAEEVAASLGCEGADTGIPEAEARFYAFRRRNSVEA